MSIKYEYIILWKLGDGTYELYKKPFPTRKEANAKIKELEVYKINSSKKFHSRPKSNAGIINWDVIKTKKNKNFMV